MRPTSDLYRLLDEEGIILRHYALPPGYEGYYVVADYPSVPHIILDERLLDHPVLYRAVLAHELGHHYSLAGNTLVAPHNASQRLTWSRLENKAERWAVDFMVPADSLMRLWKRYYPVWEIAERLQVPQAWVLMKLQWLSGKALSA